MPVLRPPRRRHNPTALKNLNSHWNPVDPAPPPANVNLLEVFLLQSGALVLEFDGPVIIDSDNPPTTWSFNGTTSIQPGILNYGTSCYLIPNGPANAGDPVVFAANDPAARTPGGGYVNAVTTVVSDM